VRISGVARAWFRARRADPFAVVLSIAGSSDAPLAEVLAAMEAEFRTAHRASVTSSLARALLAGHEALAARNALALPEHRVVASAIVATARGDSLYIARTGATLVGAVDEAGSWAHSGDPAVAQPTEATPELGAGAAPHGTSELLTLEPGSCALLLPGVTIADLDEAQLVAALHGPRDLTSITSLLGTVPVATSGLVVWRPRPDDAIDDTRWQSWAIERASAATITRRAPEMAKSEPVARSIPRQPTSTTATVGRSIEPDDLPRPDQSARNRTLVIEPSIAQDLIVPSSAPTSPGVPGGSPALTVEPSAGASTPISFPRDDANASHVKERAKEHEADEPDDSSDRGVLRPPAGRARSGSWVRLLPLVPLALLLVVAVVLLRGMLPPGGAGQSVADAGRIMEEAQSNPDPAVAAGLLDRAIAILQPLAPHDQAAQTLLVEAQDRRDSVLDVVRVAASAVRRFPVPVSPEARPVGVWRGEDELFVFDSGTQVLYRTDETGTRLEPALRPPEVVSNAPLGKLVSTAWSPPRGSNTQGMLLLLDHVRTIISVGPRGTPVQRWIPPDSGSWQRLGAAAATFDTLYVIDAERQQVLSYPARQPGAGSKVAAASTPDLDLGAALDLATDGNLFVLLPRGRIAKLAPGGAALPFDGTIPDGPLTAPVALFASEGVDRLWVLEPTQARVVELTVDGAYVRQYVLPADMMRNAVSLHVDTAAGELRVLTPQAVLLVEMDQ
jgi:hypothetical protein